MIEKRNSPPKGIMPITDDEFHLLRDLVSKNFGIQLDDTKRSLLVSRLNKLVQEGNFSSFQEYYEFILADHTGNALSVFANSVTTNHTYFNREPRHFEYLVSTVLPVITKQLIGRKNYDLRIWCSACATGEEAYMLAILIQEFFGPEYSKWNAGLLATDISESALTRAKTGIYYEEQIKNLDTNLRNKYFNKIDQNRYQVISNIRNEITFRRFNLMNEHFSFKKNFDIIFCRNVMIYFNGPIRNELSEKLYQWTNPGGYLFIGHSETLQRQRTSFQYVMPAVYTKCKA